VQRAIEHGEPFDVELEIMPPRYFVWVTCAMAGSLKSSFPAIR
jgi:hypothetical protein